MEQLDNLVKTSLLKYEPPDADEFEGMLQAAKIKLGDIDVVGLSKDSRFSIAYSAAFTLSLAALRWHGYRATNRAIVFQCLPHTLEVDTRYWRVLSDAHRRRNIAEYEGELDIEDALLESIIQVARELLPRVESLK